MVKLPNKQYIIENKRKLLLEIIDITFAYLHELLIFDDELTCESR